MTHRCIVWTRRKCISTRIVAMTERHSNGQTQLETWESVREEIFVIWVLVIPHYETGLELKINEKKIFSIALNWNFLSENH